MLSCPQDIREKIKKLKGESVSHETFLRLERYLSFLIQENQKYNLVGPREVDCLWERHVLDSAQIFPFLRGAPEFLDVGAGAGFPGVVLAILGAPGGCLVESSQKKCLFLESVSRETVGDFSVLNNRIETLRGVRSKRIVSRAVAPISTLLRWTRGVCFRDTRWIFLKGKTVEAEIEEALKRFSFDVKISPSITSPEGKIVEIQNIFF